MRARRSLLALGMASILALSLAACRKALERGEARVSPVGSARVLAAEDGESFKVVEGSRMLRTGGRVKVVEGVGKLELPDDIEIELRQGGELRVATDPSLVTGQLLAVAPRPASVEAGGSLIRVSGVARISRDLAVSAASYRGELVVGSAGRSLRVPALRQAAVATLGVLPAEPVPLRYRLDDSWDRRFLGRAIDLGEELQSRSRGLTASLPPSEGRTPGFYRLLLPALEREPAFDEPLLSDTRPPGETLVGAVITLNGRQGTFLSRWSSVFSFRQQGASWGLVALDQGVVEGEGLVRSLDLAIGQAPLAFQRPAAPPPAAPATSQRPASRVSAPSAASRPASGGGQVPAASSPPAAEMQLPRPPSTPLDPVVNPLVDVLDGLLP